MTWLLAVCVPGLLMLATFGLQRLESALETERAATDNVSEYLERAAKAARAAVQEAPPRPSQTEHRLVDTHHRLGDDEPGLPTRSYTHVTPNPQFHRTQYANRV
ncbi:hypothetical protein BayCH28_03200 [Mycolicibacterium sp. CH28]|uniref:hypothetical protein n=1 Tax=Mycolicibacterium sp. CH28 TaxID=2512237 RepID=UPI0010819B8B|nr:hypothetical protein [Mycolicibacterium sp. CH28]TGD89626.1 hypothetical protein BayCH28_03200 [Mycolicibacterium sp. CH28]